MGSSRKSTLGLVISAMPMLARFACRKPYCLQPRQASARSWFKRQCLHSLISMQMQTQPLLLLFVRQISHRTQMVAI